MSELTVGSLSGLAANSYVVDVAAGSTLDLANAKAASLPTSAIGTGGILQVVSTTKTDTFTTASTSYTDLTGLSVSITPKSASSKILVSYEVQGTGQSATSHGFLQIVRDSTPIAIGDAAGSRTQVTSFLVISGYGDAMVTNAASHLDSPATTSALTYKVQVRSNSAGTTYINRSSADNDASGYPRGVSTITVMEVAG